MSRERVREDAAERGIEVEFVERPDAGSLQEAAGLLGISPPQIVKSLVLKRSDGTFLFALIPGDRQIVIDCKAGERKHLIAEEHLRDHPDIRPGVFMILVARAPATTARVQVRLPRTLPTTVAAAGALATT